MKQTRSAGGVVLNDEGKVLVVNQRGTSWSLPKGHIDPPEDDRAAARREILEETGIGQLDYVRALGTYQRHKIAADGVHDDETELKTIVMFLFTTRQRALHPLDPKNPEARWVDKGKVADLLTHEKDREFFRGIAGEI